jgi:BMFP domain-containing protein YqiC
MAKIFIIDQISHSVEAVERLHAQLRSIAFAVESMKADDSRKAFISSVAHATRESIETLGIRINELEARLKNHNFV